MGGALSRFLIAYPRATIAMTVAVATKAAAIVKLDIDSLFDDGLEAGEAKEPEKQ